MSKEEFLKILPFETFSDIRCRYLPNGDIIEEYNYFETSPIYSLNYWVIIKNDIVEKIYSNKDYELNF